MVSFTYPRAYPIAMPSPTERLALLAISRTALFPHAPRLSALDEEAFRAAFVASFEFVATLKRTDEPKTRADEWRDRAEGWHQERGTLATVSLSAFLLAIVAAGDVNYRFDPTRWPYDVYCALDWSGRAAAPAWRSVLESKTIRPPIPAARSLYETPNPLVYRG